MSCKDLQSRMRCNTTNSRLSKSHSNTFLQEHCCCYYCQFSATAMGLVWWTPPHTHTLQGSTFWHFSFKKNRNWHTSIALYWYTSCWFKKKKLWKLPGSMLWKEYQQQGQEQGKSRPSFICGSHPNFATISLKMAQQSRLQKSRGKPTWYTKAPWCCGELYPKSTWPVANHQYRRGF